MMQLCCSTVLYMLLLVCVLVNAHEGKLCSCMLVVMYGVVWMHFSKGWSCVICAYI